MFVHMTDAKHVRDQVVWLRFNDGLAGEEDLSSELDAPVLEPLRDPNVFRQFRVDHYTLSWINGADFAPEFLHERVMATV